MRGACPVHRSASLAAQRLPRILRLNIYKCFKCGSSGNQLDLYVAVTGLSLFDAAVALCEQLHHEVPWMVAETPSWSADCWTR